MNQMTRRAFGAAGMTVLLAASVSFAQQPQTFRIRAQIEKVDGSVLMVKDRAGAETAQTSAHTAKNFTSPRYHASLLGWRGCALFW